MLRKQEDLAGARAAYELAIESGHADAAPMAARNLAALGRLRRLRRLLRWLLRLLR